MRGGRFTSLTRRSKIVSRATGRYAATSFDQLLVCPMSSFVGVAYFFLSPKAIARFRVFQKNVMKKVITHNSNTVNVLSSFFSLFTFEFNHVLPFPGSACYYAEVLGLLVRVFFFFFFSCFGFF